MFCFVLRVLDFFFYIYFFRVILSFKQFFFRVLEFFEGSLEFFFAVVVVAVVDGLLELCWGSLELFEGPLDFFFFGRSS